MPQEVSVLGDAPLDQELAELRLQLQGVRHCRHDFENRSEQLCGFGFLDVQDDRLDRGDKVLELLQISGMLARVPHFAVQARATFQQ